MDKTIRIEKAGKAEADRIIDLARRTFVETYGENNDPGNMALYVNESLSPEALREELEDGHARFYVAYLDGDAVGFLKIRDDRPARALEGLRALELQRIYVLKEFQGYNVGKALMEMVKELAREENYQTIWLQVWQKNDKAVRFYQHAGFVVYETASFRLGNDIQDDFLMRYDLYL